MLFKILVVLTAIFTLVGMVVCAMQGEPAAFFEGFCLLVLIIMVAAFGWRTHP